MSLAVFPDDDVLPVSGGAGLAIAPDEPIAPVLEAGVPLALAEPLMQVLPVDFPLPALIRFVPDVALKAAADAAVAALEAMDVSGPEGLQRVDAGLTVVRERQAAIEAHFLPPATIANDLHKAITSRRAEWLAPGKAALELKGRALAAEKNRLERLAADERRRLQDEANAKARAEAEAEARKAEAAKAPAAVVEQLKVAAATVQAAPVAVPAALAPPVLSGTTTVTTWKARIAGTPADAEPNPEMAVLSPAQRVQVLAAMKAIVDGREDLLAIFSLNWSVLNGRAKSDKSTMTIVGFEAFPEGSARANGRRRS